MLHVYRPRWCQLHERGMYCDGHETVDRPNVPFWRLITYPDDILQAEEAPSKQLDFIQAWAGAASAAGSSCWERILAAAEGVLSASQHRARLSWLLPACWTHRACDGMACQADIAICQAEACNAQVLQVVLGVRQLSPRLEFFRTQALELLPAPVCTCCLCTLESSAMVILCQSKDAEL